MSALRPTHLAALKIGGLGSDDFIFMVSGCPPAGGDERLL